MAYQTRCNRIRLRPESLDRVREWAAELNRRTDEALATLRDENVVVESVFLERTPEGDFLIYYGKAESFANARDAVQRSQHSIDAYHRKF